MEPHPPDFWRRKARALLVPSPFSPRSPDHGQDEHERLARIEGSLGAMDADQRARIERAARDAHDAHVPGDAQEHDLTWCQRIHPLSGKPLETRTAETFFAGEETLRALAGEVARADDPRPAYRRLWRKVMECGANLPGSFALPDHSVAALRSMTAALVGARADGCRAALLYMHIGPVQGFIKASRRTHDLWVGSYTVGYLAMQAILAIAEEEGPDAIVYPDLAALPLAQKLLFGDTPGGAADVLRSSLANRFLAVVAYERAEALLAGAHERVAEAWARMAEQARDGIDRRVPRTEDMWSGFCEQIDTHLEIDAVVQPWPASSGALADLLARFDIPERERPILRGAPDDQDPERTGAGYGALFDLCHRTLTAYRKTTLPPSLPGDARPKCSQCGQREQMVRRIDGQSGRRPLDRCRQFNEDLSRALSESSRVHGDGPRISYQLARGEGLCAVCWTKRMAPEVSLGDKAGPLGLDWGQDEHRRLLRFPGVVTIATAPFRYRLLRPADDFWERKPGQRKDPFALPDRVETWLDALAKVLDPRVLAFTAPGNLLYGLDKRKNENQLDPRLRRVAGDVLAHDGEWLYDSNYEPETAWRNHFGQDHQSGEDKDRFERLEKALKPARSAFLAMRRLADIEASSYYAVLVLDGDDMGKWLTGRHPRTPRLADMLVDGELARRVAAEDRDRGQPQKRPLYPALHRELARRLAQLAIHLHEIVDEHLGRMVYSGGDDVMAFLPLATALPCARAIEHAMRDQLGAHVTASAGLAIAHMRMPLGRTLDDARKAEDKSKQRGKDRLTVHVAKRSGAPVDVTVPWRARRHQADVTGVDVIEALIDALRRDEQRDESARPLSRVDVACRLEQEFRLLHEDGGNDATLAAMLFERMSTLLRKGTEGATRARVDRLLDCMAPLGSQDRMNLLLLLRFLMREEHGIDTVTLLQDLGIWPWRDRETRP